VYRFDLCVSFFVMPSITPSVTPAVLGILPLPEAFAPVRVDLRSSDEGISCLLAHRGQDSRPWSSLSKPNARRRVR
jgi:hypothetical protein